MAVANEAKQGRSEDLQEIIELLKKLTNDEKNQVKGIMIGMQMYREQLAVKTA